jgi:hypothetical protein
LHVEVVGFLLRIIKLLTTHLHHLARLPRHGGKAAANLRVLPRDHLPRDDPVARVPRLQGEEGGFGQEDEIFIVDRVF